MARHIDQDINVVAANQIGQIILRHTDRRVPRFGDGAKAGAIRVLSDTVRVADNRTLRPIEMFQRRQNQKGGWMLAKVGREQAKAKMFRALTRDSYRVWEGMRSIPLAVGLEKCFGRNPAGVLQTGEELTVVLRRGRELD